MKMDLDFLKSKAKQIRKDVIISLAEAGSGHLGSSLGLADIFTALYFEVMNVYPDDPKNENRDRLIVSIGHVAPVIYATLAHRGFFPIEELMTLRKLGSRLQGHSTPNHGLPGIEVSTGSLGQGLSIAIGMALAAKIKNEKHTVFCILGDGELQEGQVWEAFMSAPMHNLDNLVAIIDRNNCQIDGFVDRVMDIEPLKDKLKAFNWEVYEIDGHNIAEIVEVLGSLKLKQGGGKPKVVVANTLMGRGVKSIENNCGWHGKPPAKEDVPKFLEELENC
jgi:transketolase